MNIQDALVKLEYKEPDIDQLAILHNFTSDEQKMIKMFWEPAFNQGWLYLSDEIILEQMTNEKGRMALTDFYNRVLLAEDYIENIDYKKIKKDDELIKKYEEFGSANLLNQKNKSKQTTKKYYAITVTYE